MIIKRQEFADICGRDIGYISVYISRGKIVTVPGDSSKIDTDNPINKAFKKRCKELAEKPKRVSKAGKKNAQRVIENPEKVAEDLYNSVVQKFEQEPSPETRAKSNKKNKEDEAIVSWDLRKKIADTLKAEKQAEKEKLTVEKLMGNLMPVDLVEQILRVNIQDIFKSFENDLINLASIYCDILAGGDRKKLADLVGKMRNHLEGTIEKTRISAAQEIENVVKDYADTRNRGERK